MVLTSGARPDTKVCLRTPDGKEYEIGEVALTNVDLDELHGTDWKAVSEGRATALGTSHDGATLWLVGE